MVFYKRSNKYRQYSNVEPEANFQANIIKNGRFVPVTEYIILEVRWFEKEQNSEIESF